MFDRSRTQLPDGIYDIVAYQEYAGFLDFTKDEVIIDRPLLNPAVHSQTAAEGNITITGWFHSSQSNVFTVSVDGTTYTLGVNTELTNTGNKWMLDTGSTLAVGRYDVVATSIDPLGNTASDSTVSEINIHEISGADAKNIGNFHPKITGEFDNVTTDVLTVKVVGTTYTLGTDAELTDVGGGQWVLDLEAGAALAKGFHDVVVTATDNDTATVTTDTSVDEIGIFNVIGTVVSDTLTGNLGSKNGIISNGGYDTITGGNLHDAIAVTDNYFLSVDGGKGLDTLILAGDGMNLTSIDFSKLFSIEAMDLSVGTSSNTITLNTQDVLDMSSTNSLTIMGESTDTVNLGDWSASTGTQVIDSVTYDSYSHNGASLLIEQGVQVTFI